MSLLQRSRHRDEHGDIGGVDDFTVPSDELAYRPSVPRVPRRRSSGLKFFASSSTLKPEPIHSSHKDWEANYLKDLRVNRPARPGGSRPCPGRAATSTPEPYVRASSALSFRPSYSTQQADPNRDPKYERSVSALSHRRAQMDMLAADAALRELSADVASRKFSTSTILRMPPITPSGTYRESGMRWMEKQEARSLREALEDMDLRDEAKVHAAAQGEASELVWKHRNQAMPQMNSDRLRSYKQHLEKGAHARSQSVGWHAEQGAATGESATSHRSVSNTSKSCKGDINPSQTIRNTIITFAEPEKLSEEAQPGKETGHVLWDSPQKKAYMSLNKRALPKISSRRRSTGPRARDVSGGLFRNPEDKIYEEPDSDKKTSEAARSDQSRIPAPLVTKNRNTMSKDGTGSPSFTQSRFSSAEDKMRVFRSEIHRNPPSQSRNPSYLENPPVSTPPGPVIANHAESHPDFTVIKNGKEVRSEDIRAATTMRMKDRSPKLPSPTVISNRPGRPIVSFEQAWKSKDTNQQEESCSDSPSAVPSRLQSKPQMPGSTASAPIVPTINVPDPPSIHIDEVPPINPRSIPSISISNAPIPTVSLPEGPPTTRPLPSPSSRSRSSPANRPLPHHSSTTPVHSSKLHWTPSSRRATAQCAACALPIEGRIVSAASQRFHPHCFTCHHCAEPLECVAFYPEPDSARAARVERIENRVACNIHVLPDEKEGETAADDGDSSLRFYCHLDYHELYSPRCRSCKTPIESEVVLACGGSWHIGHFFCAECGDPFDAKTPFVEKNGYAWCVGCHAGKFSGKCKGCRKPVVEGGVSALGSEWHVDCFCCVECGGQFDDGRFFIREDEEKPV
ncbi:MAG: hypothetical protein ALECFALPRED_008464, partial [Alectoria fallacina]